MKKIILYFYIVLVITGCKKNNEMKALNSADIDSLNSSNTEIKKRASENINPKTIFFDSINSDIFKKSQIVSDTLMYPFEIEDISSDGNEGIAFYHNLTLVKIKFKVQNSNRVSKQTYIFKANGVVLFSDSLFLFNEDYSKLSFEESSLKDIREPLKYDNTPFYYIEFKARLPFLIKKR